MATDLESAATAPAIAKSDLVGTAGLDDSVVLHGISWKMYRRLRKMPDNYNVRMTYDRGELEIMSPSPVVKAQEIVRQFGTAHETALILSFRNWVRDNVQPGG